MEHCTDIFIIGGGINGVGIAADAAGRGLNVVLCEQGDLAQATSSKSSKLIHGGLRYLEYYEFRLVKEALEEREILLKKAPHIIHPLEFIMPSNPLLKPRWKLSLGLFIYDHLNKHHRLSSSHAINLRQHNAGLMLKKKFTHGFSYMDCWADDARLVILNAMHARQLGATILTHTRFISAVRTEQHWEIDIANTLSGEKQCIKAKALVNASGPWVEEIIDQKLGLTSNNHIMLIKGSHIVIPRVSADDFAFILMNTDNRVVFITPFLKKYSLIGTTEIPFEGNPYEAEITHEEINYLCKTVNSYFEKDISSRDIIWSYSGVRPLHYEKGKNPSATTRDYTLELDTIFGKAPLLSVFGGKITTYRKLAEHALQKLKPFFPHAGPAWTAHTPLPGGDIPNADFSEFYVKFCQQYPWLPSTLSYRYASSYGTLAEIFLRNKHHLDDLGENLGADLYECELHYLIKHEWAIHAEDILWRRTKLGLFFSNESVQKLREIMDAM